MRVEVFDYVLTMRLALDDIEGGGDMEDAIRKILALTEEFRRDVIGHEEGLCT